MNISEIYDAIDKCQDICDSCKIGGYCMLLCPVSCPTALIMYRLCDAYDILDHRRRVSDPRATMAE